MKQFHLLALAALTASCASYRTPAYAERDSLHRSASYGASTFDAAVFSADSAVISDEEIAAALDYEYQPSKISSVALLPCGQMGRELIGSEKNTFAHLRAKSPHLKFVRIPQTLLPSNLNAATLRSVAARLQSDTVILYEFRKNLTYQSRVWSRDTAKFWVTLEYYLFDTRTGLIPYSNAFDFTVENKKSSDQTYWEYVDENFREISTVLVEQMADDLSVLIRP